MNDVCFMHIQGGETKKIFDGTQELECAPQVQSGDEVLGTLEGMVFGDENAGMANKDRKKKRKKRKKGETSTANVVWKKKSNFFRLPYWKDNLLRHNLDVMHIEKNVIDNILDTILDISGKTKDDIAARRDLLEMGLRHKLHPFTADNGITYMPVACHTMSKDDWAHVPACTKEDIWEALMVSGHFYIPPNLFFSLFFYFYFYLSIFNLCRWTFTSRQVVIYEK
jgi:hypothetical protein